MTLPTPHVVVIRSANCVTQGGGGIGLRIVVPNGAHRYCLRSPSCRECQLRRFHGYVDPRTSLSSQSPDHQPVWIPTRSIRIALTFADLQIGLGNRHSPSYQVSSTFTVTVLTTGPVEAHRCSNTTISLPPHFHLGRHVPLRPANRSSSVSLVMLSAAVNVICEGDYAYPAQASLRTQVDGRGLDLRRALLNLTVYLPSEFSLARSATMGLTLMHSPQCGHLWIYRDGRLGQRPNRS